MKIGLVIGLGIAVGIVGVGASAHAGKVGDVTCEQFLAMEPDAQDDIVYWVEGADVASSKKAAAAADVEVGYDAFGVPVAEVVTACKADKKAKLLDQIRAHFRK